MRKALKSHSVGYKNPPKETRFKKGQSGNPSGRPRRRPSFSDTFLAELEQKIPVKLNGRKRLLCPLEALANQIVLGAARGDRETTKLLFEVLSRFGGKDMRPVCELRFTRAEMEV